MPIVVAEQHPALVGLALLAQHVGGGVVVRRRLRPCPELRRHVFRVMTVYGIVNETEGAPNTL